jgi:bifunctional UDP-N-acetylglucosamine pyrophosphorylase/glucosamine-1-phosphate N-acetyltransferase
MSNNKLNKITAVILAGEMGEEMQSDTHLVLHPLAGQPMVFYAIKATTNALGEIPFLFTEQDNEQIRQIVGQSAKYFHAIEQSARGLHLLQTEPQLRNIADHVLVIRADMPLLSSTTLEEIISTHKDSLKDTQSQPRITLLTFQSSEAEDLPRVNRGPAGNIETISEDPYLSDEGIEPAEYDVGVYCFPAEWLWQALPNLSQGSDQLLDVIQRAIADGLAIKNVSLANPNELLKIQNRIDLAKAESVLRQQINNDLMLSGVTIIDPISTYIDAQVKIGRDTVIHPNTYLRGETRIGEACSIGPNCFIVDTNIGDRCEIIFAEAENAILEDDVDIGPFANLRSGAHLAQGVHMGNYGEVKNSYLGPGTKMGHFSYIGDATIGAGVNIGAGVITANYDGENKHHTEIGAGAFIGSDSMLVAPLKIGEGARTGAGSVVTKDVPPNSLAVGIPARVIRKEEEKDGS